MKNLYFKTQNISLFLLFFLFSFFFFHLNTAFAQNISLGIYPPIIQITATPPTDIQSPFTVINNSDTTVQIHILVRPFKAASSNNGQPAYLTTDAALGADKQIFSKMAIFDGQQNTQDITLAPSQKKNLELRIHLPNGEPPGDYYFSITMLSNSIKVQQKSSSYVAGGISTNVLLSIGPQDKTTGFIKEFSAPWFVDKGPVPFTLLVNNSSKHFITPQGTILIKNMFGQLIGKVDLLPVNILANSSRYLSGSNIQDPTSNISRPTAIWPETFLLGPYSASVTIALSGEGPVYHRTIYFFALPLQVLIGLVLGIILTAIIVYRVKKHLER